MFEALKSFRNASEKTESGLSVINLTYFGRLPDVGENIRNFRSNIGEGLLFFSEMDFSVLFSFLRFENKDYGSVMAGCATCAFVATAFFRVIGIF